MIENSPNVGRFGPEFINVGLSEKDKFDEFVKVIGPNAVRVARTLEERVLGPEFYIGVTADTERQIVTEVLVWAEILSSNSGSFRCEQSGTEKSEEDRLREFEKAICSEAVSELKESLEQFLGPEFYGGVTNYSERQIVTDVLIWERHLASSDTDQAN
ncbi:hypothetical protein BH23PAT1_BH23PAT1_1420 [soil metagenome]